MINEQLSQDDICEYILTKPLENLADIDTKNRTHNKHARVAQWLEHWSSKPGVDSSILSSGIKIPFFIF